MSRRISSSLAMTVVVVLAAQAVQIPSGRAQSDSPSTGLGSVDDYLQEENPQHLHQVSELGIEVSDGVGKLASGTLRGPAVIRVVPNSPASHSGLRGQRSIGKAALMGVFIAGGLFFPPAIFGAIVVAQSDIGESHDTIVAVDSERTRNVRELENAIDRSREGPILYLSIVRGGQRNQVRVFLHSVNGQTE